MFEIHVFSSSVMKKSVQQIWIPCNDTDVIFLYLCIDVHACVYLFVCLCGYCVFLLLVYHVVYSCALLSS